MRPLAALDWDLGPQFRGRQRHSSIGCCAPGKLSHLSERPSASLALRAGGDVVGELLVFEGVGAAEAVLEGEARTRARRVGRMIVCGLLVLWVRLD